MKTQAYIVNATYRAEGDDTFIYLFGRTKQGRSFTIKTKQVPYFFIKEKDEPKLKKALESIKEDWAKKVKWEKTKLKTFEEEPVIKINLLHPQEVPKLREKLDCQTYEADIRFVRRFYIDKDTNGFIEIEGNAQKQNISGNILSDVEQTNPKYSTDLFFNEPEIKPIEHEEIQLKVMSLDIETYMNLSSVLSITAIIGKKTKTFLLTQKQIKEKDLLCYPDEKSLIESFKEYLVKEDPDIIVGWNVIDFDLKVLQDRARKNKIKLDLGREIGKEIEVRSFNSFFRDSKADVEGRVVLDILPTFKFLSRGRILQNMEDYRLGTVSETVLGKTKVKYQGTLDNLYKNDKKKFVEYNIVDAQLVLELIEKLDILNIAWSKAYFTGVAIDEIQGAVLSLDSLYLREARKRGLVCKTSAYQEREERIKGALVLDAKPGIYDNILVFDFKSLYPSMMITFNLDPLTKDIKGEIKAPNGVKFRKEDGIIAPLLIKLRNRRALARKQKNEALAEAIKLTMNSIYGVLANPSCRFYSLDVANAITSFGRFLIRTTKSWFEEKSYEVIYGDTDSLFIKAKGKSQKELEEEQKTLEELANKYYDNFVQKNYKRKNYLYLEFKKLYIKFWLPTIRSTDEGFEGVGTKKRYAGVIIEDGKKKMEFVGLEFVRRDWTELAKKFQYELLKQVFFGQDVIKFVKDFVSDFKKGKYDDLLIYKKAIRKGLQEYTKTTPPHVKAARKLPPQELNRVLTETNVIQYIMTKEGPEPTGFLKHEIDKEHYLQKQLKPIADSILEPLHLDFETAVREQHGLGRFVEK